MKFTSLLTGAAALASVVSAVVVTGAGGAVQTRYEVRQLLTKYPQQFTLFLLAMQEFKNMDTTNLTSYYQISGIHGCPRVTYDGVAQCSNCASTNGYCTHNSILFPAWHRTYLAFFEQELTKVAKDIANQYPSSTRAVYQAAAAKLRLPYWDWAAKPPNGGPTLPISITAPSVTLDTPTGSQTILNPLLQYTLPDPKAMVYATFTTWPHTLRYPSSNAASATSNENKDIQAFNNIRGSLQDRLYQLFSTCTQYSQMGLDAKTTANAKCASSLEGLHNTIHTVSGGPAQTNPNISGGHMTYLATAAFDPIFWLHHAMVDRIFAMWQAVYPDSYGYTQTNLGTATWTIPKGATIGATSNLTPFHRNSAGAFWNTNLVRSTKTFAYQYPEFADSNGGAAAIKSYINALYGPSATATAGSSKRTAAPEPQSLTGDVTSVLGQASSAVGQILTPLKAANGSLFQYVANIETPKYALGGSYFIYLFNGAPYDDNPDNYLLDSNLIGPIGILSQDNMADMNVTTTGSIPLTRSLTEAVSSNLLSDLTEATVVPFLLKNLQLRIVGPDGALVNPNTLEGFDISVFASSATPPTENELPEWSEFILLEDVTKALLGQPVSTPSPSSTPSTAKTATSKATTATGKAATTSKATATKKATKGGATKKTKATATSAASAKLRRKGVPEIA